MLFTKSPTVTLCEESLKVNAMSALCHRDIDWLRLGLVGRKRWNAYQRCRDEQYSYESHSNPSNANW